MRDEPIDSVPVVDLEDLTDEEKQEFEKERSELRDFVAGLSPDDLKSGNWFEKLIAQGLVTTPGKPTGSTSRRSTKVCQQMRLSISASRWQLAMRHCREA